MRFDFLSNVNTESIQKSMTTNQEILDAINAMSAKLDKHEEQADKALQTEKKLQITVLVITSISSLSTIIFGLLALMN